MRCYARRRIVDYPVFRLSRRLWLCPLRRSFQRIWLRCGFLRDRVIASLSWHGGFVVAFCTRFSFFFRGTAGE